MALTIEQRMLIGAIGRKAAEKLQTGDPEMDYARHLAAHAILEEQLTGSVSHHLSVDEPCPYCGQPSPLHVPELEKRYLWGDR